MALLTMAPLADGSDAQEIAGVLDAGQLDKAEDAAMLLMKERPEDPSPRFALALIAEQRNDSSKAMDIYVGLNHSHPTLLEPYNNLAIHHAKEGNYETAAAILIRALQSNPTVATVYKNLTAIYDQMASQAYRKALNTEIPLLPLKLVPMRTIESRPCESYGMGSFTESTER